MKKIKLKEHPIQTCNLPELQLSWVTYISGSINSEKKN